jgi:nitrogen fixation NifU-like protein
MASSLEGLYQQVILDHARERHGYTQLSEAEPLGLGTARSRQYNPLCGDEVTLQVTLDDTGAAVDDLRWTGDGCSISQAATSVLYDLVIGQGVDEAKSIVDEYRAMLRSRGESEPDEDILGDAVAFAGVSRHANRVKCAMLGWTAFEAALMRGEADLEAAGAAELGITSPSDDELKEIAVAFVRRLGLPEPGTKPRTGDDDE